MIQTERVPTGIEGLDQTIEGGLAKGRSILVTGEPGTGKTIFALQFLFEGLKRGEKCMYVAADEGPIDVLEQAASLGWDLERYADTKELSILNASTYLSALPGTSTYVSTLAGKDRHVDVQKAVSDLAAFVNQIGVQRLVLDPAGPFFQLRDNAVRIQDQTRMMIKMMRSSMKTTNVLTSYAVPRTGERSMHGIEEYLVAGAIVLEMFWKDGQFARSLIVEKMRCTNVKPTQLEFDIQKGQGIVIQPAL